MDRGAETEFIATLSKCLYLVVLDVGAVQPVHAVHTVHAVLAVPDPPNSFLPEENFLVWKLLPELQKPQNTQ